MLYLAIRAHLDINSIHIFTEVAGSNLGGSIQNPYNGCLIFIFIYIYAIVIYSMPVIEVLLYLPCFTVFKCDDVRPL